MARVPGPRRSRVGVALVCTLCQARNYRTTRARKERGTPLTLRKFCKACDQHTQHVESK